MASSSDVDDRAESYRQLGAFLTATEAGDLADRLTAGESLTAALAALSYARRLSVGSLIMKARLGADLDQLAALLRAVEGARLASSTRLEPMWTMPGHLVQAAPLTSSVANMVRAATTSVTCSTYNFQSTSGLWDALHEIVRRPQPARVRVYLDTQAAESKSSGKPSPSLHEVADWLRPGKVLRTKQYNGYLVRNHAKFLVIDHRFVLVTSANFSHSAEFYNVEFGVKIDSPGLAESVEREARRAEDQLYEPVT